MLRLFVLLAAICGWLAIACSDSTSSGGGNGGASAGGNAGTGGSSGGVDGNGGGGGPSTMPPNPNGLPCEDGYMLQQKADGADICIKNNTGLECPDGSYFASSENGDDFCVPFDGGTGGSSGNSGSGGNIGGSGGSGGGSPPVEQCPSWYEVTDDRSPCLLGGRWIDTELAGGWVEFTITKIDNTTFTVKPDGEIIPFHFELIGSSLPLEGDFIDQGYHLHCTIDINPAGLLILHKDIDGHSGGGHQYRRNDSP